MAQQPSSVTASETVRRRVKELRTRRGWSARQLAEKCAEAGAPHLDRSVLANFENGRRSSITIDEVLVLALVLDVAPIHLFVPVGREAHVSVGTWTFGADLIREWVRGRVPLPSQNARTYRAEVPDVEWDAFEAASRKRPPATHEETREWAERAGFDFIDVSQEEG